MEDPFHVSTGADRGGFSQTAHTAHTAHTHRYLFHMTNQLTPVHPSTSSEAAMHCDVLCCTMKTTADMSAHNYNVCDETVLCRFLKDEGCVLHCTALHFTSLQNNAPLLFLPLSFVLVMPKRWRNALPCTLSRLPLSHLITVTHLPSVLPVTKYLPLSLSLLVTSHSLPSSHVISSSPLSSPIIHSLFYSPVISSYSDRGQLSTLVVKRTFLRYAYEPYDRIKHQLKQIIRKYFK